MARRDPRFFSFHVDVLVFQLGNSNIETIRGPRCVSFATYSGLFPLRQCGPLLVFYDSAESVLYRPGAPNGYAPLKPHAAGPREGT